MFRKYVIFIMVLGLILCFTLASKPKRGIVPDLNKPGSRIRLEPIRVPALRYKGPAPYPFHYKILNTEY